MQEIVFEGSVYGYQHDDQKIRGLVVRGFAIHKHLKDSGIIEDCLSLEDASVWIENSNLYPEDFKKKRIFLWKSVHADKVTGLFVVPCLEWWRGKVEITYVWLGDAWCNTRYAAVRAN